MTKFQISSRKPQVSVYFNYSDTFISYISTTIANFLEIDEKNVCFNGGQKILTEEVK